MREPPDAATLPPVPPRADANATVGPSEGFPSSSAPPAAVPGYEILSELGRGGMGVVYKARQVSLNRVVALKMILAGSHAGPQELRRFRAEAEAVARLKHPNIIQVYQVGEVEGRPFLALEFVGGGTLAEKLAGRTAPPREAARLVEVLARAVHVAHQRQIVHRDLKPGNVLLEEDGTPKVTDFGLAKQLDGTADQTRTGVVLGTPEYMAPEQAEGIAGRVGPAADVYALGAILYEMLTGRPPFQAASTLDTVLKVISDEPEPPSRLAPAVPADLETVCLKCLEKDPARRYGSALDLAEDCAAFLRGEPIQARRPRPLERLLRWASRQPALATTLIAVAFFYLIHLVCLTALAVDGEGGFFHWFVTALSLVWVALAVGLQRLARRPGWEERATFAWASLDVLLLTLLLWVGNGPSSAMSPGYFLLIGGAALRYRPALVWFVGTVAVLCYLVLVVESYLFRPELGVQTYRTFIFAISLGLMALVFHLLLRKLPPRALDRGEASSSSPDSAVPRKQGLGTTGPTA